MLFVCLFYYTLKTLDSIFFILYRKIYIHVQILNDFLFVKKGCSALTRSMHFNFYFFAFARPVTNIIAKPLTSYVIDKNAGSRCARIYVDRKRILYERSLP